MSKIAFLVMTLAALSAFSQTSPQTKFITDPAQLTAKQRLDIQPLTIDKLYMTRTIGDSTWSPDGKQVAFVANISGRNNIWVVDSEGGWPTQLTVSNQRQVNPAWSPNGRWIAYASDYDGNEQWDIFLVSPKNGQIINLTNTAEISEEGPVWSPDGDTLAYAVKPKNSASYEINLIDIGSKKITQLTGYTPRELGNFAPIWAKDGTRIVFTQAHAAGKNSNIFVADTATGKATSLTPHSGEHNFFASDISPDGKTLLITSNSGNGYNNVGLLDVASKKITWLTSDKWEISAGKFSPDGKRVTWTANIDGNQDIFLYDLPTQKARALPVAKGINDLAGSASPFTRDGGRLLFVHNGPNPCGDCSHSSRVFCWRSARAFRCSIIGHRPPDGSIARQSKRSLLDLH